MWCCNNRSSKGAQKRHLWETTALDSDGNGYSLDKLSKIGLS